MTEEPAPAEPRPSRDRGGRVGPFRRAVLALDRASVLFIGVALGVTIGLAYAGGHAGEPSPAQRVADTSHAAAASSPSGAQPPDCAAPFSARLLRTISAGRPVTVGVFGDSFGVAIWAALYWTLPKAEHYQVVNFAEHSTGFTRYQQVNLEDKAAEDLATQPIDIAVIDFGANDARGIVDAGHVYPLLSPGWKGAYARRIARFVALLRGQGAMIYWVGLPKMRNPDFDRQVQAINAFYASQMATLGVAFIPTEALSVDERGQFNNYLYDPQAHRKVLMRANDGIHMSIPGYARISAPLVGRIESYVARSRRLAVEEPPDPAAADRGRCNAGTLDPSLVGGAHPAAPGRARTIQILQIGRPPGGLLQSLREEASPGWVVDSGPHRLSATAPGAKLTLTSASAQAFRRVTVCAEAAPGAGAYTLTVGATSARTMLEAPVRRVECESVVAGQPQDRAVLVTDSGPVTLTSWSSGGDGGDLASLGAVGSEVRHFVRANDAEVAAAFRAYHPDLVIVAASGLPRRYSAESNLRAQLRRVQGLANGAPILVLNASKAEPDPPGLQISDATQSRR